MVSRKNVYKVCRVIILYTFARANSPPRDFTI